MSLGVGVRLLLACAFAVAGVAKLARREDFRTALRTFGIPPAGAAGLSVVVPVAELGVAALLLPAATARAAAAAALVLLAAFSVAIIVAILRGEPVECQCFGPLRARPLGRGALARNAVLAAGAAFALVAGPATVPLSLDWVGRLRTGESAALLIALALAVAVAGLAWFALLLLRQNGRLLARVETLEDRLGPVSRGLAIGAALPPLEVVVAPGGTVRLRELAPGAPLLLVFSDPSCAACGAVRERLGGWARRAGGDLAVIEVGTAPPGAPSGPGGVLGVGQRDGEVGRALGIPGTPAAVLVAADDRVASEVALGPDAVAELAEDAIAEARERRGPDPALDVIAVGGEAVHA